MKLRKYLMGTLLGCLAVTMVSASAFAYSFKRGDMDGEHDPNYLITRRVYVNYLSDGTVRDAGTDIWEYNEHGDDEDGSVKTYDENGRLIQKTGEDSESKWKVTYVYDSKGNLEREIGEGDEREYNASTGEYEWIHYEWKKEYTYDDKGNTTSIAYYNKNMETDEWELGSKEEYEYDVNGSMIACDSDTTKWRGKYEYEYNTYGDITKKVWYEYDDDSQEMSREPSYTYRYEYEYNNGTKVKCTQYLLENDGTENLSEIKIYDEHGNVVQDAIYMDDDEDGETELWREDQFTYVKKSDLANLPFVDVSKDAWYTRYVRYVFQMSLMNGTSATTFEPQSPLSRAMVAQILYNRAGRPEVSGQPRFSDVSKDQWYYNAVQWASEQGIVSGIGDGKFAPNANVTREQLAMMLYNAQGKPETDVSLSGFEDTNTISDWAVSAVKWAVNEKIINGSKENEKLYINPMGNATRAEAATMFTRYDQEFD